MKISTLATDENAVSSTLGVVLLVSVTVILAAIVGAFAFGLVGNEAAPNAEFDYDFNGSDTGAVVTHAGGDTVDASRLDFGQGWGETGSATNCGFVSGDVSSGDVVIDQGGDGDGDRCRHEAPSGEALSIVWESSDGESYIVDERER